MRLLLNCLARSTMISGVRIPTLLLVLVLLFFHTEPICSEPRIARTFDDQTRSHSLQSSSLDVFESSLNLQSSSAVAPHIELDRMPRNPLSPPSLPSLSCKSPITTMAEFAVPDERPIQPSATAQAVSRALEHLRPFQPLSDAGGLRTTKQAISPPAAKSTDPDHRNGSANICDTKSSTSDIAIPPLPTVISRVHARVQAFLAESHPPDSLLAAVQRQTQISLNVVTETLSKYKLSELSLSYNGGKDCLVLLIIFLAGLHPYSNHVRNDHKTTTQTSSGTRLEEVIPSIYALPPDPFPDVEEFVVSSAQAYHLSITKYTTDPPNTTIRTVFEDYLNKHPGIKAIFVGTRRTDPHGANLTHFARTDRGWPDFMRVHPVIDWHYAEIWAFIRHLGLEYCSLYDMGYTSLGGTSDTHPNPRLRVQEETRYLPAYELTEDVEERLGRH